MMSKKKWILLLILFIIYLLLGASFFHKIESEEEMNKLENERQERIEIMKLLRKHYISPETAEELLIKLGDFCGKAFNVSDEVYDAKPRWDFYHSVFFTITVVTTIGYGNLAPTTPFSRIFMILYALIGIPMNGILYATLGDFFGRAFIKLYKRWKISKVKDYAAKLGLISQIILYLIPGFTFFIFLPATIMMIFEGWEFNLAVYYAFVTLTTIGFGDYVAGVTHRDFGVYSLLYQVFLIIWIIFGLGYLVMVLGFISRGMRSKKMIRLEKQITHNIKSTQSRIWHGFIKDMTYFRRILNELYMAKFKPVYRDEFTSASTPRVRSQSFPDLRALIATDMSPAVKRRRAFSECIPSDEITRVQSDTDLDRIDKEATFTGLGILPPCELLAKVADALATYDSDEPDIEDEGGVHGFTDSEILASERYGSRWTLGSQKMSAIPPKTPRVRAASEIKIPPSFKKDNSPTDWTWSGPAATQKIQEIRQHTRFIKSQNTSRSENTPPSKTFFNKIKNTLSRVSKSDGKSKEIDIEKQVQLETNAQESRNVFSVEQEAYLNSSKLGRASVFSVPDARVLEETSVADLLRAISSLHSRVAGMPEALPGPRRKLGTASLTPPKIPSVLELFTPPPHVNNRGQTTRTARRSSLAPSLHSMKHRRFSLHPVSEDQLMTPPPPYTPCTSLPLPEVQTTPKETVSAVFSGPPNLVHKQISRLRGPTNARLLYTRTRHNSLKDIRIDRPFK